MQQHFFTRVIKSACRQKIKKWLHYAYYSEMSFPSPKVQKGGTAAKGEYLGRRGLVGAQLT